MNNNAPVKTSKRTIATSLIAGLVLVLLVGLLVVLHNEVALLIGAASAAGLLVIAKETLTAFARGNFSVAAAKELEDWAAIASLFAAVFGVPAVVGAVISLAA